MRRGELVSVLSANAYKDHRVLLNNEVETKYTSSRAGEEVVELSIRETRAVISSKSEGK